MRVLYLFNRIPWFGAHTGYERLPDYMEAAGISSRTYVPNADLLSRTVGKAVSLLRGHGSISQSDASARLRLELALRRERDSFGHILYGEEHLPYWADAPESARQRTFITLHQPREQLGDEKLAAYPSLSNVIVLWQREIDWFREQVKNGQVHFVPHGVDTEFFSPRPVAEAKSDSAAPRLLYVGLHMRNPDMLARVIARLHAQRDDLIFDLLVPVHRRLSEPSLASLTDHPNIRWHENVDDEGLRELYRAAHLLLLPLQNSGANTAVVEALSCGLPVVTTDVGGIRDYGGGTVFPVVENDDDEAMLTLIEKYLAPGGWRDEVSRACRVFAEEHLAWPIIARRHVEIYRKALA